MGSGYAFELAAGGDWRTAPDNEWDIVMVTETEATRVDAVGTRKVDGKTMGVWRHQDGRHFAQRLVSVS